MIWSRTIWIFGTAALLLVAPSPAEAGPVAAAITAIGSWFGAQALGVQIGLRLLGGVVLNRVGAALQKRSMRRQQQSGGIRTEVTLAGGVNPDSLIMGVYATQGSWVSPWRMWGEDNYWNTQVIDLSGVPQSALRRLFVNGQPVELGAAEVTTAGRPRQSGPVVTLGRPAIGAYADHLFVRFLDGSQTAADPLLLSRGHDDPDFPWTDDMVGLGRTIAIVSYLYNPEVWQGIPSFRFELGSARFYDMRRDSTIGGLGAHRLDDPATWEPTDNPMVAVAHIALGYRLPDGNIYGGDYTLADLPLADWAAAMNACDQAVTAPAGGTEPAFRAGLEILFDEEPITAIGSLLQACDGEIVDVGGRLYPRAGAAGLPVAFITDADLIVTAPEDLDPFPGLQDTVNGIAISHPSPAAAWEQTDAPLILSPGFEAADGGRRLVQSLDLPAVPYAGQAQRLGQALVRDARRFIRHGLTLPGDLAFVRPLQTVSWTSARNGYTAKLFELGEQAVDLFSYQAQVSLREVDPADYDPQAYLGAPAASALVTPPAPVALRDVSVIPWSIANAEGPARPAIRASWAPLPAEVVEIEISLGAEVVASVIAPAAAGRAILSANILPATQYAVRLRVVPNGRPTAWAGPFLVTAPDVRVGTLQIGVGAVTLAGVAGSGVVTNNSDAWTTVATFTLPALPASGFLQGHLSFTLVAGQQTAVNYPANAEWRVTVNNVVAAFVPRISMLNRNSPFFFGPFTRAVAPGNVTVLFEMRNMGGLGVGSSNLFAQAALR